MWSLWALSLARMRHIHHSAGAGRSDRAARRFASRRAAGLWVALLVLALAGCGTPLHVPLDGPGLHRTVSQGGQNALQFWWLPPTSQNPQARLLLWDGADVGLSNPAATDQSFAPLANGETCGQVAVAPDNHAFACGLIGEHAGSVLVQSLDDLNHQPEGLLDESAPFAWAPDSRMLAALRLGVSGSGATCSVIEVDTALTDLGEDNEQVLLNGIPFTTVQGKDSSVCPVMDLAWSPDGARLALSLAASNGVVLEVLRLGAAGQPPAIESRNLLPGTALQTLDTLAVPSLFWSADGQTLAALSGYGTSNQDGLFLLAIGQQTLLTGPNLIDTGSGAALAFSPDGHWLAVGAAGSSQGGDNAQLRVFDVQNNRWDNVASMFARGATLAWSANGSLLAAASIAQQGEAIWNWPSASLSKIIPNQYIASIEQLGWAQDGSALLFTIGSHSSGTPFYDEIYAQRFPVPPGVSSFAFPGWFLNMLEFLPQGLIWLGVALLVLIVLALLLVLIERGRSRRRRAFIVWTMGVCAVLFLLGFVGYNRLPGWIAHLYQPYSEHLCQGAPAPCNPGAMLAVGTPGSALLLGLLVILVGALITGRKPRLVPEEGLPRPVARGPLPARPAQPEEPPLLLEQPIEERDTLEHEIPPVSLRKPFYSEREEQDWQQ